MHAAPPLPVPAMTAPVAVLARIRARLDGEPVLWWWQGEVFGKRPGEIAKRLLIIHGIGFNRMRRLAEGHWESRMSEAGYYLDVESGQPAESWTNPYTGESRTPPQNRLRLHYCIEDSGLIRPPVPDVPFEGWVAPPQTSGDTVWSSERLAASFAAPESGANTSSPLQGLSGAPMEVSHFSACLNDFNNPDLAVVPANMSHSTLWSFYPWMGMPPDSGYVLSEIIGRKLAGPLEIPRALREKIERDYPGFLAAPDV